MPSAVWSGSILFAIYATKEHKQMIEQTKKIVTGMKKVKIQHHKCKLDEGEMS